MDAEACRLQAVADARSRPIEAISKVRQEGDDIFLCRENLESIVRNGLLSLDPNRREDAAQ
jgi:hypothetical protein